MSDLAQAFKDRLQEIDAYLDLLTGLEIEVQKGPPKLGNDGIKVSSLQVQILYSSVYLQLYNLVEATVSKFVDAVCDEVAGKSLWKPGDLTAEIRKEWVRFIMNSDSDMAYETRLLYSIEMCEHLINLSPIDKLRISKGGGGNWDDNSISDFAKKIGCALNISPASKEAAKRHIRNDQGAMVLVKKMRNDLAHGTVSFADCGSGVTVSDLKDIRDRTVLYLEDVIKSFTAFIEGYEYLHAGSRPTQ